jgi:transposase
MLPGNLNAEQYVHILENVLLPSGLERFPEGFNFVQDNASIHTSKMAKRWFVEHPEINLLPWPPKGADLNPIENVWGRMVHEMKSELVSKTVLWEKVFDVWEKLAMDPDIWIDLTVSMLDRLQLCIDANGNWTRY